MNLPLPARKNTRATDSLRRPVPRNYKERELWDDYMRAFEDVFAETSKKKAPWYIIPSNHKWFRDLAVSQIVAATMEDLGMKTPKPQVDLDAIRKQYHQAVKEESSSKGRK